MDASALQVALDSARRKDERAVEQLCAHFQPRLASYVERSLGQHARRRVDVDEVVQQALFETLRALDHVGSLDLQELQRRLHQVARSRMRDALRKWRREVGESVLAELGRDPVAATPSTGTVTREDTRTFLLRLLDELPDEQAQAVRLCALEELSFVAAGQRLGLSPDAVRKRYERARETLVRRLAGERGP